MQQVITLTKSFNCWLQDGLPLPFTPAAKAGDVLAHVRARFPQARVSIPSDYFGPYCRATFGRAVLFKSAAEA